jgi:hypothetical protein
MHFHGFDGAPPRMRVYNGKLREEIFWKQKSKEAKD